MDEFSNGYDIHGKERLTMLDWILSWLMPANIALKGLKTPLQDAQASKGYIGTPQSPKQAE
jgi:hypothetical protein